MNCDFLKSLTKEQKQQLREALDKSEEQPEQYRVNVVFWDEDKTKIKSLAEYKGNQLHGKYIGWNEDGQKYYEEEYQNGKQHGKYVVWYKNGQKAYEYEYQNGKQHGKYVAWYDNGQKLYEEEWQNGNKIK